jgi:hypothetical protein
MRHSRLFLLGGVIVMPAVEAAHAGTISVTLPQIPIAEYKKPYIAGWIEPAGGGAPRTLFVWYALKKGGNEPGTKWLADMRSWWRKAGRSMKLPVDGITGATKGPGTYSVPLPADLAPGNYTLSIEAARENGGRELVSVPVAIPNASGRTTGKTELGAVVISAK